MEIAAHEKAKEEELLRLEDETKKRKEEKMSLDRAKDKEVISRWREEQRKQTEQESKGGKREVPKISTCLKQ